MRRWFADFYAYAAIAVYNIAAITPPPFFATLLRFHFIFDAAYADVDKAAW